MTPVLPPGGGGADGRTFVAPLLEAAARPGCLPRRPAIASEEAVPCP
jgi:hypothetical protein